MLSIESTQNMICQLKQLSYVIDEISSTKQIFIDFVKRTQQVYSQRFQKQVLVIKEFRQMLDLKNYKNMDIFHLMVSFSEANLELNFYLNQLTQLRMSQISGIQTNWGKKEEKIKIKLNGIAVEVNRYCKREKNYNQKYSQYENKNYQKLQKFISIIEEMHNPIKFFELSPADGLSKDFDSQINQCENSEISLRSTLAVLDQNRKTLIQSFSQIKDLFLNLLHNHLNSIFNYISCLTNQRYEQLIYSKLNSIKLISSVFSNLQRMQNPSENNNECENNNNQEEVMSSKDKQFFNQLNTCVNDGNIHIDILIHRVQLFMEKKSEKIEQQLEIKKAFFKQIHFLLEFSDKIDQDVKKIEKKLFKSFEIGNFNKKIMKYFGKNTSLFLQLCEQIIKNPQKRVKKIHKYITTHLQKMEKMIQFFSTQLKYFRKRITIIMNESKLFRIEEKKNNVKIYHQVLMFTQQSNKNRNKISKSFTVELENLIKQIKHQLNHSKISYILKKQKENQIFQLFQKIDIENEIIHVVKEDRKYDLLFHQKIRPVLLLNFKTLIDCQSIQKAKKILQKKCSQQRNGQTVRNIGCCGFSGKPVNVSKLYEEYTLYLNISKSSKIYGEFKIKHNGIQFKQNSFNPFAKLVNLFIPVSQMVSLQKKINDQQETVVVNTRIGSLIFYYEQCNKLIESLKKYYQLRIQAREEKRQSKTETSSFLKMNSFSTDIKISTQNILNLNQKERSSRRDKGEENKSIKKFIYKWKNKFYFSQQFVPVRAHYQGSQQEYTSQFRQDYNYKQKMCNFFLNQKVMFSFSSTQNYLKIKLYWKVSFPQMPILKSFRYNEQMQVQIKSNITRIILTKGERKKQSLFIYNKFYTEINEMNRKLIEFIVHYFNRQFQVIEEQQKVSSESMIQLGAETFDETNSVFPDNRLSRYSSLELGKETSGTEKKNFS